MSEEDDAQLADAILARSMRDKATRKVNFDELADQLSEQLEKLSGSADGDAEQASGARALAAEGRELANRFRGWADTPPSDAERNDTIHQMTKFNQSAMGVLSKAPKSSGSG